MNDTDLTYHLALLLDELRKRSEREMKRSEKNKTLIYANRNTNDKLTG